MKNHFECGLTGNWACGMPKSWQTIGTRDAAKVDCRKCSKTSAWLSELASTYGVNGTQESWREAVALNGEIPVPRATPVAGRVHYLDPRKKDTTCCGRHSKGLALGLARDVSCGRCKKTEAWRAGKMLGDLVNPPKKDDPLGVLNSSKVTGLPEPQELADVVTRAYVEGVLEEVPGSEPWEMPAFMKVDAVDALSALTLFEHLRNDGVPGFDAMRSALASYLETL